MIKDTVFPTSWQILPGSTGWNISRHQLAWVPNGHTSSLLLGIMFGNQISYIHQTTQIYPVIWSTFSICCWIPCTPLGNNIEKDVLIYGNTTKELVYVDKIGKKGMIGNYKSLALLTLGKTSTIMDKPWYIWIHKVTWGHSGVEWSTVIHRMLAYTL